MNRPTARLRCITTGHRLLTRLLLSSLPGLLLLLFAAPSAWAVPGYVQYSGRLTDGAVPTGSTTANLRVKLYNCACAHDDTSAACAESLSQCEAGDDGLFFDGFHEDTPLVDGYFTLLVGQYDSAGVVHPDPASSVLPTELPAALWLTVSVNGAAELVPRQALASVPYALSATQAADADSLEGSSREGYIWNQTAVTQNASFKLGGSARMDGAVGIGTAPSEPSKLIVRGVSTWGEPIVMITSGGDTVGLGVYSTHTGDGWAIARIVTGDVGNRGLYFHYKTAGKSFVMRDSGNFYVPGNIDAVGVCNDSGTGTCANDVAETFTALDPVEPGDLVALDPTHFKGVRLTRGADDPLVAGVISTNPTLVMGRQDGEGDVPLALTGVVPVKVCVENGPIRVGDPLSASSTPGVAMRAGDRARVFGRAMEVFDGDGDSDGVGKGAVGTVHVLLSPSVMMGGVGAPEAGEMARDEGCRDVREELEALRREVRELRDRLDEVLPARP